MKVFPIWTEENVAHIAEHGVAKHEAVEVLSGSTPPYPEDAGEDNRRVRGQTESGRYLQVVFAYKSSEDIDYLALTRAEVLALEDDVPIVFVIHARDLTSREKSQLRRRRQPLPREK